MHSQGGSPSRSGFWSSIGWPRSVCQGWLQALALLRPPFTPKKGMEGVFVGVSTVWALRVPHLLHFMEVQCALHLVDKLPALSEQVHGDYPSEGQDGSLRDRAIRARYTKGSPCLYSCQAFAVLFVPHTVCTNRQTPSLQPSCPTLFVFVLRRWASYHSQVFYGHLCTSHRRRSVCRDPEWSLRPLRQWAPYLLGYLPYHRQWSRPPSNLWWVGEDTGVSESPASGNWRHFWRVVSPRGIHGSTCLKAVLPLLQSSAISSVHQ